MEYVSFELTLGSELPLGAHGKKGKDGADVWSKQSQALANATRRWSSEAATHE